MPSVAGVDLEPRFDLNVSNAPAAQVFMSIVSGTRYSILLHPDVSGVISVSLKNVTVEETLSAIRELYGYEYRAEGTRIFVQPAGMQTRVFQVNYPPGQRRGTTDLRVTSGAVTDTGTGAAPTQAGSTPTATTSSRALETSRVTTQQQSDLWPTCARHCSPSSAPVKAARSSSRRNRAWWSYGLSRSSCAQWSSTCAPRACRSSAR